MKLKLAALLLVIAIIVFSVVLYRANRSKAKKETTAADIAQGKSLVEQSDCLTCHKMDIKLIGPALKDIAAKYPANDTNYQLLTQKVVGGGNGVWGEVAMSPHPDLAATDAKKMVQYILSIK